MTNKTFIGGITLGFGLAALIGGGASLLRATPEPTSQKAKAQAEPKCKISPVEAIKIAQKKVPGRTLMANFEYAEGKWVYGVMIVNGTTIKEVEIDPMTGKIGDVETVTPEDEAKEMKNELTKAIGGTVPNAPKEDEEKDEKKEKE